MSCVIMVMQPWLLKNVFHSASLHQALAGAAPRLSTRGMSVLPRQTTKQTFFWLLKKGVLIQNRCVRSFTGWFKSSRVYCVSCSKFAVMIVSSQSVISRVYTLWFGNGMVRLEPQPKRAVKNLSNIRRILNKHPLSNFRCLTDCLITGARERCDEVVGRFAF